MQPPHGVGRAGAGVPVQAVQQGALPHGALQDRPGEVLLEGEAAVRAVGAGDAGGVVDFLQSLVRHQALSQVIDGLQLLAQGGKGLHGILFPILGRSGPLVVEDAVILAVQGDGVLPALVQQPLHRLNLLVDALHLVRQFIGVLELALGHQGLGLFVELGLAGPQLRDLLHVVHFVPPLSHIDLHLFSPRRVRGENSLT